MRARAGRLARLLISLSQTPDRGGAVRRVVLERPGVSRLAPLPGPGSTPAEPADGALSAAPRPIGLCSLWRVFELQSRALLLLAAGLPLTAGCATHFLRPRAERRIRRMMVERIGPAEEYHVRIRGTSDASLVSGRLHAIEIDGRNVWAGRQIELESLHLELHNLRYHPAPEERVSVGESHLMIQLTGKALNDYLRREQPVNTPGVTLGDGTVTLRGFLDLLGVPTPMVTTGRLAILDGTRLVFKADTVHLSGEPIPGIGPEYVESHLNPLLNLSHLNLPLRMEEVEVQPDLLMLRGSVSLPLPVSPR